MIVLTVAPLLDRTFAHKLLTDSHAKARNGAVLLTHILGTGHRLTGKDEFAGLRKPRDLVELGCSESGMRAGLPDHVVDQGLQLLTIETLLRHPPAPVGHEPSCIGVSTASNSREFAIVKPLPNDAGERMFRPLAIVHPQSDAVIIAEIELRKIAVKMPFAAMLVNALHPALEDRKEPFCSVHVGKAANVFVLAMVDGVMAREGIVEAAIDRSLVCHKVRAAINVREKHAPRA